MNRTAVLLSDVIKSKTEWGYLILFVLLAVTVSTLLYILIIPLAFWHLYGEGAESDRIGSLRISIFIGEWLPLFVVLGIFLFNIFRNMQQLKLCKAKSHLLGSIIIIGLYLLRVPILDVAFDLFQ